MSFVDLDLPFDEAENYLQPSNKNKFNSLFYKEKNFDKLLESTTYFLIGDKGSGKTAYSAYFCNNIVSSGIHSKRYVITVDDYGKIIQMKRDGKLNYSHYITMWKAIILIKLFATLDENEVSTFGLRSYNRVKEALKKHNLNNIMLDSFSPTSIIDNKELVSNFSIGFDVKNVGLKRDSTNFNNVQREFTSQTYTDIWSEVICSITESLSSLRLKNHHYLFIDGIDSRPSDIDYASYVECVYPLVRAVYEINADILSRIKDRAKGRLQIVLLTRLDIFLKSGLSNPGSKISDNCAFLNWANIKEENYRETDIFLLVNNMLREEQNGVTVPWDFYFGYSMLTQDGSQLPSFVYFLRNTTIKPRDFVKILKIIQEQCKLQKVQNPTKAILQSDQFRRAYSTYYADSIRTMLSFYYDSDDIQRLFGFIRSLKTNVIEYTKFLEKWNSSADKTKLEKAFGNCNGAIKVLFDANALCYIETDKDTRYRWKYRETTLANYDFVISDDVLRKGVKLQFHPALEKEFGLY